MNNLELQLLLNICVEESYTHNFAEITDEVYSKILPWSKYTIALKEIDDRSWDELEQSCVKDNSNEKEWNRPLLTLIEKTRVLELYKHSSSTADTILKLRSQHPEMCRTPVAQPLVKAVAAASVIFNPTRPTSQDFDDSINTLKQTVRGCILYDGVSPRTRMQQLLDNALQLKCILLDGSTSICSSANTDAFLTILNCFKHHACDLQPLQKLKLLSKYPKDLNQFGEPWINEEFSRLITECYTEDVVQTIQFLRLDQQFTNNLAHLIGWFALSPILNTVRPPTRDVPVLTDQLDLINVFNQRTGLAVQTVLELGCKIESFLGHKNLIGMSRLDVPLKIGYELGMYREIYINLNGYYEIMSFSKDRKYLAITNRKNGTKLIEIDGYAIRICFEYKGSAVITNCVYSAQSKNAFFYGSEENSNCYYRIEDNSSFPINLGKINTSCKIDDAIFDLHDPDVLYLTLEDGFVCKCMMAPTRIRVQKLFKTKRTLCMQFCGEELAMLSVNYVPGRQDIKFYSVVSKGLKLNSRYEFPDRGKCLNDTGFGHINFSNFDPRLVLAGNLDYAIYLFDRLGKRDVVAYDSNYLFQNNGVYLCAVDGFTGPLDKYIIISIVSKGQLKKTQKFLLNRFTGVLEGRLKDSSIVAYDGATNTFTEAFMSVQISPCETDKIKHQLVVQVGVRY